MKKIYTIGTKQNFTYSIFNFFGKNIRTEEHWVVRNVKYIYANNKEEAKEKYEKWFFVEHRAVLGGWGDWYRDSGNISLMMNEECVNVTSTKIVLIDEDKDINVNLETLKERMQAEDFKEWWFDNQ